MKLECQIIIGTGKQFLRFYRESVEIEDPTTRAILKKHIDESTQLFASIAIRDPKEREDYLAWYNRKKVEI